MVIQQKTIAETIELYDKLIDYAQDYSDISNEESKKILSGLSEWRKHWNTDDYQKAVQTRHDMAFTQIAADDTTFDYLEQIKKATDEYNEAVISGDEKAIDNAVTNLKKLQEGVNSLEMATQYSNVAQYFNDLFDAFNRDINEKSLEETITKGMKTEGSRWNKLTNSLSGKTDVEAKSYIETLADDSSEYETLHVAMEMFGVDTDQIIKVLELLGIVEKTTVDDTNAVTKAFSVLEEQMKDTKERIQKFDSAIDKLSVGENLNVDDVNSLLEIDPSLLGSIEKTADGYTIAMSKITAARHKAVEKQKSDVRTEIAENEKEIALLKENIKQLEANKTDAISGARNIVNRIKSQEEDNENLINQYGGTKELFLKNAPDEIVEQYHRVAKSIEVSKDELKDFYGIEYNSETIVSDIADAEGKINKKIEENKEKIKDVNAETAQYKFLLDQMENPLKNWGDELDKILNKVKAIGDKYQTMIRDQKKYGQASPEAILDFITEVPNNWQEYIQKDDSGKY